MNFFVTEIVTPPTHLPITSTDDLLARAVVDEVERVILWRAIVSQERKIVVDGALPAKIELEPVTAIVSLTRWTQADSAVVIDASNYNFVSRDPAGAIIAPAPGFAWPEPARDIGSFALTYLAGWEVTDSSNLVPASIQHMLTRAVEHRAGAGLADISIGSLQMDVADSYKTDALPREIASIGAAYAYRPGIFAARP